MNDERPELGDRMKVIDNTTFNPLSLGILPPSPNSHTSHITANTDAAQAFRTESPRHHKKRKFWKKPKNGVPSSLLFSFLRRAKKTP
jgi:hypothetical protein